MAWCDPCAAQPLSREELYQSGVFWLDGDVEQGFHSLQNPALPGRVPPTNGAQPVLLTRLHVRYKPRTFPEDLMFVQTGDTQNWQARYIIQNPYGGTVAECSARVGKMDCAAMCEERVSSVQNFIKGNDTDFAAQYRGKNRQDLSSDCLSTCEDSKARGVEAATRYYHDILPDRIAAEKQTLAQLTAWSLHDIDAIPGATRFSALTREQNAPVGGAAPSAQIWWQKLFSR